MALFTYNGPYESVELKVAGYEIGTVEQGGSIVVPDDLADSVEWQDYWKRADQGTPENLKGDK